MRGSGIPGVLGFGKEVGEDSVVRRSLSARESMAQSYVVVGTFAVQENLEKLMIIESSWVSVICRRKGEDGAMAGVLFEVRLSSFRPLWMDPTLGCETGQTQSVSRITTRHSRSVATTTLFSSRLFNVWTIVYVLAVMIHVRSTQ
jgi:hypothetical protein